MDRKQRGNMERRMGGKEKKRVKIKRGKQKFGKKKMEKRKRERKEE